MYLPQFHEFEENNRWWGKGFTEWTCVNHAKSLTSGHVIKKPHSDIGYYCLLNKKYVKEYGDDVRLFLEWKVRFTMNFAACRGVFAQVFQNNWVNGSLYMFSFNTRKIFGLDPTQPLYNTKFYKAYCDDVVVYNDISNNFGTSSYGSLSTVNNNKLED